MKTLKLTYKDAETASKLLQSGGIVAFPTETVYGLGIIYDSRESFDRLVSVKHRRPDKPFTLMCGARTDIDQFVHLTDFARKVINEFLPGPLTLVLPAKDGLPAWVDLGTGKVGIRVPSFQAIRQLILKTGKPLLVPSANRADEPPALSGEAVMELFDGQIDGVIFGTIGGGTPSTVIEIDASDHVTLIRQGELALDAIEHLKTHADKLDR